MGEVFPGDRRPIVTIEREREREMLFIVLKQTFQKFITLFKVAILEVSNILMKYGQNLIVLIGKNRM
jgi:hypothetical protein